MFTFGSTKRVLEPGTDGVHCNYRIPSPFFKSLTIPKIFLFYFVFQEDCDRSVAVQWLVSRCVTYSIYQCLVAELYLTEAE